MLNPRVERFKFNRHIGIGMREVTSESDGSFDMEEYERELAEIVAPVVPDDHPILDPLK